MRHCLAYLVEGQLERYYTALTKDISEKFSVANLAERIAPHMTLVYPFEMDDTTQLEKQIEQLASGQKAVPFTVKDFDSFDGPDRTIFLKLIDREKLAPLIQHFSKGLAYLRTEKDFNHTNIHAHISLVRHLDENTFNQIWQYLHTLPVPEFKMSFDNVTLFVFENKKWNVKKIFRFAS